LSLVEPSFGGLGYSDVYVTARGSAAEGGKLVLIGYMRVSKADGSQVVDLQNDALVAAGVAVEQLYADRASGKSYVGDWVTTVD